jgi:hypothetical protein|tara:strand:- start:16805 stop:17077 length:273 start_codon:yes stop_codon:yes gene_type:complete
MKTEIKELTNKVEGVVAELTLLVDHPDYWIVKRNMKAIRRAAKVLAETITWGELTKTCPACGNKPDGCEYCNGRGKVNKQMHDFREQILP